MGQITTLRVFISSPSDLRPERTLIKDVIAELNNTPRYRNHYKLIAYAYEDVTPSLVGIEPQIVVDENMLKPEEANIFICMFWHRMGTPTKELINPNTNLPYQSGTEYEFSTAYQAAMQCNHPQILLYRCARPVDPDQLDPEQFARVKSFFARFTPSGDLKGLVGSFRDIDELKKTLWNDLVHILEQYQAEEIQAKVSPSNIDQHHLHALLADHSGFIKDRLNSFVGREHELTDIRQRIIEKLPTGGYVTITGQAGEGKSSVIAKLVEEYGLSDVAYHFIPFNPGPDHQVSLLRNLMARLILKYNLSDLYVASESRPALRDYFSRVLIEVTAQDGREVIFIDGLDQLEEDANGVRDLSFLPTNPPAGIVFVLGTRPNDTLKPLELLKPRHEYQLAPLSRADFDLILSHRGVQLSEQVANRFYKVMQANALYLDLVAKELAEAESNDPEIVIRHIAANPDNIFSLTMGRLKRQRDQWNQVIKPVLGFLLAAREPLGQHVLRALLRIDSDTLREGLQRMGGLIAQDGRGRFYLYHLKLQDFLRQDIEQPNKEYIFDADEEEQWHWQLADWCGKGDLERIWEDCQGVELQRRLYAREHYITHLYLAGCQDQLWTVLDNRVYGRRKVQNDPSTRSYAQDLDLGRQAAGRKDLSIEEGMKLLSNLWRYSLLRCSLASQADNYPMIVFEALVVVGRQQEAIGTAELLTNIESKILVLQHIGKQLGQQPDNIHEAREVLLRACEVARTLQVDITRAERLIELGLDLIELGENISGWQILDESVRIIQSVGKAPFQLLRTLVGVLVLLNRKDEVKHLIQEGEKKRSFYRNSYELYDGSWGANYRNSYESYDDSWGANYGSPDIFRRVVAILARMNLDQVLIDMLRSNSLWSHDIINKHDEDSKDMYVDISIDKDQLMLQAKSLIEDVKRKDKKYVQSLAETAVKLAQLEEHVHASRLLNLSIAIVRGITDEETLARALMGVSFALVQAQQLDEAKAIAETIKVPWARAEALGAVAEGLVQAHRLGDAVSIISSIKQGWVRSKALANSAVILMQRGEEKQAIEFLDEAVLIAGTISNSGDRAIASSAIAVALANVGRLEEAKTYQKASNWMAGEALGGIAKAYIRANRLEEAIQLIHDSHLMQWERVQALTYVAQTLVERAKLEQARYLIDLSLELARRTNIEWLRAQALSAVGVTIAQVGNRMLSEQVFNEAISLARSITHDLPRSKALNAIASALAYAGMQKHLLQLIQESWMESRTRNYILLLIPMSIPVTTLRPQLGKPFANSFSWVDDFLKDS